MTGRFIEAETYERFDLDKSALRLIQLKKKEIKSIARERGHNPGNWDATVIQYSPVYRHAGTDPTCQELTCRACHAQAMLIAEIDETLWGGLNLYCEGVIARDHPKVRAFHSIRQGHLYLLRATREVRLLDGRD